MRPRDVGTAAESAVVRVLRDNGFPHAERRALRGNLDCGDVTGTPGVCWEVKGGDAARRASDGQVAAWLAETERERVNARADVGVLVVARAGIGLANAGRWWAVLRLDPLQLLIDRGGYTPEHLQDAPVRLHLADACALLVAAGYGTPETEKDRS